MTFEDQSTRAVPIGRTAASGRDRHASHEIPRGVEYHRVLAGEKRRIGRGVLAVVLLAAGFVVFPTVLTLLAAAVDARLGNIPPGAAPGAVYTPLHNAATMLSLGLLVPWSMLVQRWLYGVRAASLHSVVSRFRFDVFGRALMWFGPLWVPVLVLGFLAPSEEVPWSRADLVGVVLGVLLLTPLQAAGEEYGVRGLMFRVVGSWTRGARSGLVLGVPVTAVLFTLTHGATDPFIVTWYLALFTCLALITWRTGGLEVAVVLHAVLNTVSLAMAPLLRVDLGSALGDRSAGTATAYQLVPTATIVVITAVVWWTTRRTGPVVTPTSAVERES